MSNTISGLDISEAAVVVMARELYTFDSYWHFRAAYDTHDMCAPCRHKEGRQECTRVSNCQYFINWSDIEWSLYERNLQRTGRRQRKLDQMQRHSLRKTPWQLALKIQKTVQQRNRRWRILIVRSSLLTRVLSKRIAVMRDTDHEASPAPAKRLKSVDDRGHEDRSRFLRGPDYRRQTLWTWFLQEPYVHSTLDRNSYHRRMPRTVTLPPLNLDRPPSPWIFRCFIAYQKTSLRQRT